jgi:hypothetical protein
MFPQRKKLLATQLSRPLKTSGGGGIINREGAVDYMLGLPERRQMNPAVAACRLSRRWPMKTEVQLWGLVNQGTTG